MSCSRPPGGAFGSALASMSRLPYLRAARLRRVDLVVVGAGGHAREIASLITDLGTEADCRLRGVFADWGYESRYWMNDFGCDLLGGVEDMGRVASPGYFVLGVGDSAARAELSARLLMQGWQEPPPLIHPTAVVAHTASLAHGSIVFPAARVGISVRVERQAHITVGATIGHDTTVGECSSLLPGSVVSGSVSLGARTTVGANATILEGIRLCSDVTIGAGAVVTRDVATSGATLVGVPARSAERQEVSRPSE